MTNTLQHIPLTRIDGSPATLGDYADKVLLVVNVASKCSLTPQYEGLESLYRTYRERGLEVLGFPANDFAEQEPGTEAEISNFCTSVYGVEFPLFSKTVVTGANTHPLYEALIKAKPETEYRSDSGIRAYQWRNHPEIAGAPDVHWNFEKFLIDRRGKVVRRFGSDTDPLAPVIVQAVEEALSET